MANPTKRNPGRQRLLQGFRTLDNKDMGDIIEDSSIDDLEWFLQIVEHQLEETPRWVSNSDTVYKVQTWDRRVRSLTIEALHNKRIAARRLLWLRKIAGAIALMIVGAVIAFFVNVVLQ